MVIAQYKFPIVGYKLNICVLLIVVLLQRLPNGTDSVPGLAGQEQQKEQDRPHPTGNFSVD
jgi:hypothetical protein